MNEFKKALHDVAGDLSDSERNVKNAVLYNKKRKKKASFILIPTVIMTVLLLGFTLALLPKSINQTTVSKATDELLYEHYVVIERFYWQEGPEEVHRLNGYNEMLKTLGVIEYAKSLGLEATQEDYAAVEATLDVIEQSYKMNPSMYEQISEATFRNHLLPIFEERLISMNYLKAQTFELFPIMTETIAGIYSERQALQHMEARYEKELAQFREQHTIDLNSITSSANRLVGTVAAVEGNVFYFVQNMTLEEVQKMSQEELFFIDEVYSEPSKSWVINDKNVTLQVGDWIKIKSLGWHTEEKDGERIRLALTESIELLQRAEDQVIPEITLTTELEQQFKETFMKLEKEVFTRLYDAPVYIVHTKDATYKIWETANKKFNVMRSGEQHFVQFSQADTKKFKQLFQAIEAK